MANESVLILGGTEISNAERWTTYTKNLGILTGSQGCSCPNLAEILDDDPYSDPQTDLAPWYDPDIPESQLFAGLWIQSWTGIDASTVTREFRRNLTSGGSPSPPYDAERVIAVTGFLAAASEPALSYGISWLASALRGGSDCGGCIGDEVCFLCACPEECSGEPDPDELWRKYSRHLYDVAIVDGPKILEKRVISRSTNDCCITEIPCNSCAGQAKMLAKVEFTITAGNPWIYTEPVILAQDSMFVPSGSGGEGEPGEECTINWVVLEPGETCPNPRGCPSTSGCLDSSQCGGGLPPLPPRVDSPCACVARLSEATVSIDSPPGILPRNLDSVPIIEVNTSDAEMRRLTVRFYPDPLGFGCGEPLDECRACAEISVTYAPRDSKIVIDGRTQRAYVVCPGGVEDDAGSFLFGPDGNPVEWPVFSCGSGLCVQVLVDEEFYSPTASVSVSLAGRMEAS